MMNLKTCIALGFFDGVHIAHRKILLSAINSAKEKNLQALALTFDRSPREILTLDKVDYISTTEEKKALISSLGCDVHFLTTSHNILDMEPHSFVKEILVEKLNAKHICCGYNYRFGKNASGDSALLKELGEKMGFSVDVIDCVEMYGDSVSSSRIRRLISEGDIKKANELLGRPFSLSGTVVEGKHLGKKLGFPTANIYPESTLIKPKNGVYKTIVTTTRGIFPAITNVGYNPTVGGEEFHLETYIPNFNSDLYQTEMKIEFISYIRGELKFDNLDSLKKQIEKDISAN